MRFKEANVLSAGFITSKNKLVHYLALAAIGYFFFKMLVFAFSISPYVQPDEVTHYGNCMLYAKYPLFPPVTEENYGLASSRHKPYLYYLTMGKFVRLNVFPVSNLVFLRCISCVFAFFTVLLGYRWVRDVTDNPNIRLVFIVVLTNIPMFTFSSAGVSYDSMANFFGAASLVCLYRFVKSQSAQDFMFLGIAICSGMLSKDGFLPVAAASAAIALYAIVAQKPTLSFFKKAVSDTKNMRRTLFLLPIFLLISAAAALLYGENLVRYHRLVPTLDQVFTEKNAMKFRLFAQEHILDLYQKDKINYDQAVSMAGSINHPGDRMDTYYLLDLEHQNKSQPIQHLNRIEYAFPWLDMMLKRSVGIAGHLTMQKTGFEITGYQIILCMAIFLFVRYWRPSAGGGNLTYALLITLFHAIVLMQLFNYNQYMRTHALGIYLHGKYLFPVLVPACALGAYALINPLKKTAATIVAAGVSVFFIWGDFPYFLSHATRDWFMR